MEVKLELWTKQGLRIWKQVSDNQKKLQKSLRKLQQASKLAVDVQPCKRVRSKKKSVCRAPKIL